MGLPGDRPGVDGSPMRRRVWLIYVTVLTAAMPVYFLAAHGSSRRTLFYGYGLA